VFEGEGVSVKGSVGVACGEDVTEAVLVAAGAVKDSVGKGKVVVGSFVPGGVKLQADAVNITKVRITSVRLIGKMYAPSRRIYPNYSEVIRFYDEKISPSSERGGTIQVPPDSIRMAFLWSRCGVHFLLR
jgi:hypothetical protein